MSASLASIPKRARVIRYAHATNGERSATFTVYADDVSLGYQSGYAAIPARWYAVDAPGVVRRCWRYTGRRIDGAEREYARAVDEVRAAGWSVTE